MREIVTNASLLIFLIIGFLVGVESNREQVQSKCLELGNTPAQCEKLFE